MTNKVPQTYLNSFLQLDGNVDISQEDSLDGSTDNIQQIHDDLSPLPRIYMTNARSVFPKFVHFTEQLVNYRIGIASISETWEDVSNVHHKLLISNLENKNGFKWFGCSRPKVKDNGTKTAGGGQAIVVNSHYFDASKITDIIVPKQLETINGVIWVKASPKARCPVNMIIMWYLL